MPFDGHPNAPRAGPKGVRRRQHEEPANVPEFKAEAVRLVEASGGNITEVVTELGVYDSDGGKLPVHQW